MSAALRLIELEFDRSLAPTMSPAPMVHRTTARPSRRPTPVPSSRATLHPSCLRRLTDAPTTQRSATSDTRLDAAARLDARNLLAVVRLNVKLLESLLQDHPSPLAVEAVLDICASIDRLERRFGASQD